MNEEAQNLQRQLDAVSSEFKAYVYSISHDLSAPVRAMTEFSKIIAKEHGQSLDGELQEYLDIIVENGETMQAMMDGLLEYSRLDTMEKPFVNVSSERILKDIQVAMADKINGARAHIKFEKLPMIQGDVDQIMQLFYYLLDNAIKFQPDGSIPFITISAERLDDFWQFSVTDNGIGISQQYCEKIFGIFQRLHTSDDFPGQGVGLALAQKIVQRHGGKIGASSISEQGSEIRFTLPCAK